MKTVLITGATGNIGQKLRAHLEATGKYALRLLCLNTGNNRTVQTADLSTFDQARAAEFDGVDTVLHVAADPEPARRLGADPVAQHRSAAERHGRSPAAPCPAGGLRQLKLCRRRPSLSAGALTTTMEPAPINPSGASKLFGERVGKMFAERYDVSFIAFRIGVCQRANDNLHGPWIPFGRWGQAMWVSDRDLCRAFEHAIDDEHISFGVYNLVSRNPGMRWESNPWRVTSASSRRMGK